VPVGTYGEHQGRRPALPPEPLAVRHELRNFGGSVELEPMMVYALSVTSGWLDPVAPRSLCSCKIFGLTPTNNKTIHSLSDGLIAFLGSVEFITSSLKIRHIVILHVVVAIL
jgi:hypothetical protein